MYKPFSCGAACGMDAEIPYMNFSGISSTKGLEPNCNDDEGIKKINGFRPNASINTFVPKILPRRVTLC
jgi:hypothetical protein